MWRERVDAFWDGKRALVIGFFEEETTAAQALRPEITVAAAKSEGFHDALLVDLIDQKRWRCGCCIVDLPQDCVHVSLRSSDGAELRLELTNTPAAPAGGEWRVLLCEQPENPALGALAFRAALLSTRGDPERFMRDQIMRSGPKLIWAVCGKRHVERRSGFAARARLWPTQRAYPAEQSRLGIEAKELQVDRSFLPLKAPFAIMEHWLHENGAPCATLRVRFPNPDPGDPFLCRTAVVLVMHQRRRFREWARRQREFGGSIVDPLNCGDIRLATGRRVERIDAVESGATIVAHSFMKLLAGGSEKFDGVSARHCADDKVEGTVVAEIDFYAAALGDDIGFVSTGADAGDFGVAPVDPGGVRYARLFRVGRDRLEPRRMEDEDPLLDEILHLAAEAEIDPTGALPRAGAERALSFQGKREKLLAGMNGALAASGFLGRFDSGRMWDVFEPILLGTFAALVADCAPAARAFLHKLGGYEAYRADPQLVQALARQSELAEPRGGAWRDYRADAKSLIYRFVAACGVAGVVAPGFDLPAQIEAGRLLLQDSLLKGLLTARIALDHSDALARNAARATDLLANEAMVERAVIYCDDWELAEKADLLRAYLERRRAGEWTPLEDARTVAAIVEEADSYWGEIETGHARAAVEPPLPPPKPTGIFAAVRSFFAGGGANTRG